MTAITKKDYNTLIKEYTGNAVTAASLWAVNQDVTWRLPGGFVHSTIEDSVFYQKKYSSA